MTLPAAWWALPECTKAALLGTAQLPAYCYFQQPAESPFGSPVLPVQLCVKQLVCVLPWTHMALNTVQAVLEPFEAIGLLCACKGTDAL